MLAGKDGFLTTTTVVVVVVVVVVAIATVAVLSFVASSPCFALPQ